MAKHHSYYSACIILIVILKGGRRARDICIAGAALVMLNFELGDLREYLSATPSTSSTATIVTIIIIESKEQCNV